MGPLGGPGGLLGYGTSQQSKRAVVKDEGQAKVAVGESHKYRVSDLLG
jgi:hypothetical protein